MEKRFLLAFGLSFLVLLVYSSLMPKQQPIVNKNVTKNLTITQQAPIELPAVESTPSLPRQNILNKLNEKELYTIENNGFILRFSSKGGYLAEIFDKTQNTILAFKNIGLVKEWSEYPFKITELPRGVGFNYSLEDGSTISKAYRIKSGNSLELSISFDNITNSKIKSYEILGGYADPSEEKNPIGQRYFEASISINDLVFRKPVHGLKKDENFSGNIHWLGLRDRYFCSVFVPQIPVNKSDVIIFEKGVYSSLPISERTIAPGSQQRIEDVYLIYIGPQEEGDLKSFMPGTEQIINFGFFDIISKALQFLLITSHRITHNWGWSIILITMLVYFLLFPLSLKSMLAMKKMQALQPKIEELKNKHKDNPQKLNVAIMELYKLEKANPFAGCLPMILQIPVFFALYQLLVRFIKLKGATFLWIKDLSEPDRLVVFSQPLPFIGKEFNILPIVMAIAMFFQQRFSVQTTNASPEVAEQQKIMSFLMPVLFGVLFYKMSSGLVLYWFVNSLLMFGFQWKISKAKT